MAVVSATPTTVSGLFKKVYSVIKDLLPEGYVFQEMAKFNSAEKIGESLNIAVILTQENGITLAGSSGDIITFEDAQSGIIKQATIKPSETFLPSSLSTAVLSRSANEGEAAFKKASVSRVKSNIKSHQRFLEQLCFYGQDASGIGRVSYATATWQGVAFTAGTGTLAGVVFTNGVNVGAQKVLINPADLASGIYMGAEGMPVRERAVGGAVIATGLITAVDLKNGILTLSFVPTAASGVSSHCIELVNQNAAAGNDFLGAKGILTTSGVVFGIDNSVYGMWKGSQSDLLQTKLTFNKLVGAIIDAANKGLDRDVVAVTSFESWNSLMVDQAALRQFDSSYSPDEAVRGTEGIVFHTITGKVTVKASRFVRRSDCFIFAAEDWSRVGSSDLTMKVPGLDDGELLQKPITTNAFVFRSYSDQAVLCACPSQSLYIGGIDPLSAV